MTGSAFLPWGEIEPEKLLVTRGKDFLLIDGDPDGHHAARCRECFSLLYWTGYEGKIRVPYDRCSTRRASNDGLFHRDRGSKYQASRAQHPRARTYPCAGTAAMLNHCASQEDRAAGRPLDFIRHLDDDRQN